MPNVYHLLTNGRGSCLSRVLHEADKNGLEGGKWGREKAVQEPSNCREGAKDSSLKDNWGLGEIWAEKPGGDRSLTRSWASCPGLGPPRLHWWQEQGITLRTHRGEAWGEAPGPSHSLPWGLCSALR